MRTPASKTEKPPVITIDGPSGSGKGAITHKLAQKLGFHILDSGALYRLIGLAARKSQTSFDDEPGLARISREMVVKFVPSDDPEEPLHILLEGEEVTKSLRTDQAGQDASRVAPIAAVRAGIGELQRGFLTAPGLIADGRDMGTVVFPDADVKIYLTASAEIRALLVGVSEYRHLDADLRGPANDVGLMARALMARGAKASGITVLAAPSARLPEGVTNAGEPTRAAILGGLAELAARSDGETQAVFYFSGHGTQMPDLNGDEQGGFDEIFLPADAKGWNGAIGTVENAIVDDEMTAPLQAILDTGASVVAMLDACYSETGFRALPDSAAAPVARYIAPSLLAMPSDLSEGETEAPAAPPLVSDFVFLYAAQQNQRAFEYPLGDPADPANWYGDFTRAVAMALESGAALTWADLLQQAMAEMNANAPATQTPDAEGPLLERAVLGQTEPRAPVIRTAGDRLQAGALQGVRQGAIYEIFASSDGPALAEARVTALEATSTAKTLPFSANVSNATSSRGAAPARQRWSRRQGRPQKAARHLPQVG